VVHRKSVRYYSRQPLWSRPTGKLGQPGPAGFSTYSSFTLGIPVLEQ